MAWNIVTKMFTGIQGKIIFTMSVSLWCLVMFWLFYPYTPITIHSIEITNSDAVYPGGTLDYEIEYTKNKIYPVNTIVRQLINDAIIILAPGQPTILPIGRHKVKRSAKLPEYIGTGKHVFTITAQFQVNVIRFISITAKSDPFQVIKKERRDCNGT